MGYFVGRNFDPIDAREIWREYQDYIGTVRTRLAPSAYEYAVADWHYDATDNRSPHDGWIETVKIMENVDGEVDARSIGITITLLGAYHDTRLRYKYTGVKTYSLNKKLSLSDSRYQQGHGDWIVDEITLSESGFVRHEIELFGGASWMIESEGFSCGVEKIDSANV
jgi:hypothetical protein